VTSEQRLRELQQRFPELPLDCGNAADPGVVDEAQWRDWTSMETTPDQLRIENYLDALPLSGKRILHVGVGNSGFALRFSKRAVEIVGITVVRPEADHGNSLEIPNYDVIVHNKHAGSSERIRGTFDFIVDNNPTTFCCCINHLCSMMTFYADSLCRDGQIVTDRVGLAWTTAAPGANARWAFSFEDLAEVARCFGLEAHKMSDSIYVLAFDKPRSPSSLMILLKELRRRAKRGTQKLLRIARVRGS
jgi:hypothetical protein